MTESACPSQVIPIDSDRIPLMSLKAGQHYSGEPVLEANSIMMIVTSWPGGVPGEQLRWRFQYHPIPSG